MMSQNRETKKESIKSTNEYKTTLKSELMLEDLHDTIDLILKQQNEILNYMKEKKKIDFISFLLYNCFRISRGRMIKWV